MKIKGYIEIDNNEDRRFYAEPTFMCQKPLKREIKNAKEFGYEIYKCEIVYNKKKPL